MSAEGKEWTDEECVAAYYDFLHDHTGDTPRLCDAALGRALLRLRAERELRVALDAGGAFGHAGYEYWTERNAAREQLVAAEARLEAMRAVVEAAVAWRRSDRLDQQVLAAAVDAYLAPPAVEAPDAR